MYLSAVQSKNRKEVIVWERSKLGREQRRYPTPYYFYVKTEKGKFKDIYGNKLSRQDFDNYNDFKQASDKHKNIGNSLFESDIRAEYKVLAEHYYGTPLPETHFTFFDIEVDYDRERGHSTIEDPYAPICAVAIHHYWSGEDIVLVVPPETRKGITVEELQLEQEYPDVKIVICKNEKQLIKLFFELIEDSDIISGWNSSYYDVPYMYERAKRLFGEEFANRLCFDDAPAPKYREVFDKQGVPKMMMDLFGRESVDYMEIFKKFEVVERQSNSLESVAEDKLEHLKMKKLSYDGSLYDLYRNNFEYYVRYNIRDCEILKALEDELGYMRLAIQFAHSSTGFLRDVTGTIKLAELAIINFCHTILDAKVPDSQYNEEGTGEKFTGALVLPPQVGMHDWVASVDVASLYPSAIRATNISPETIVGQFFDNNKAFNAIKAESTEQLYFKFENGDMVEKSAAEWRNYLLENKLSISGFGSVFSLSEQGFIPAILSDWFKQRKDYKKRASIAKDAMKKQEKGSAEYIRLKHEYENCHRLQYVFKIRLNSLYGALGNKFFKFYDIRLAESTTRNGQEVLMHMVRTVAKNIDGEYMYPSESTIYSDTDSCYFLTHAKDKAQAIAVGRAIEKKVNESFPDFCKTAFLCTDEYSNMISAELDVIASKSIFIKKKYYVMQLVYAEGSDTDKIKLMGVSLKKTTIPKAIAAKLTAFVQDLLKGREWADIGEDIVQYKDWIISSAPITEVGLPKGIKGINEKEAEYKAGDTNVRLSGHASAALFYNLCLEQYNDKESYKILSGMKIKTYYLTKKFGRFKSIALPTDMKAPPDWFIKHFSDIIDREKQANRLIDKPLENILTAINKIVPSRKSLLYDELVSY